MSEVRDFLDVFKTKRSFRPVLARLKKDEAFRTALFSEIEKDEYPYSEYASWIAQHYFEHTRSDFSEWRDAFMALIETSTNHTVLRNLVHIFAHLKADVKDNGEFLDCLMAHLENSESLPALKVNAYKAIARQYLKFHPELLPEVKMLIDLHAEDTRPSIISMRKQFDLRFAKQLKKLL